MMTADDSMRIVALEEHFVAPDLIRRIDPAVIARRGFPPPDAAWGPASRQDELADLGPARLHDMDASGITLQVLSVSGPGADLLPPAEGIALARALNDRLAAAVAAHPGRYAGFAHLPMTAPEAAADELERAVRDLGFHGALINGLTDGRFLDDAAFAPILARAETLDVPLYLHPGIPPAAVRGAYYEGLPDRLGFLLAIAGWGWHAETAVHVLRLVLSGTLDRHPRLHLIIGHMGEGLPAMLARCDDVFSGPAAGVLRRPVSATVLDQVSITTSGFFTLPPFLAALTTFGADRILFSVDYPFSTNRRARAFLDNLPVAPADRAKIAHGNADRLLKLRA
jgi:predicted TIM-barrel fold metal-dependent hydrolase